LLYISLAYTDKDMKKPEITLDEQYTVPLPLAPLCRPALGPQPLPSHGLLPENYPNVRNSSTISWVL
jgi:hypothetical protein